MYTQEKFLIDGTKNTFLTQKVTTLYNKEVLKRPNFRRNKNKMITFKIKKMFLKILDYILYLTNKD